MISEKEQRITIYYCSGRYKTMSRKKIALKFLSGKTIKITNLQTGGDAEKSGCGVSFHKASG